MQRPSKVSGHLASVHWHWLSCSYLIDKASKISEWKEISSSKWRRKTVRCFLCDVSAYVHSRSGSHHDPFAHKDQYATAFLQRPYLISDSSLRIAPHEFTSISFPVKALKIILHDLQSGGESATVTARGDVYDVESDDGVSFFSPGINYYLMSNLEWRLDRGRKIKPRL